MAAQALLAQDLLGVGTQVFGAAVGPTTPTATLAVFVGPGRIYSMAALEPSAWSSLAADATQILKQGILDSAGATIACPVLGTSGQSVNYLIEGQYQENDINPQVLSYWNASNPQLPFSGAGNLGVAQPTIRAGQLIVRAKAGTPATTGSQTTPAADAGWTAIASVTVAFGATTITSGNITQLAGVQPSGTFTLTGTGFSGSAPTATCSYKISGGMVTLTIGPGLSGTSNSTSFGASGLPSFLQPNAALPFVRLPLATTIDNSGNTGFGSASFVNGSNTIVFDLGLVGPTGWTATGTKAAGGSFTYPL